MIFVILGSQKFQFNRLLQSIDNLLVSGIVLDTLFAQVGYSDYKPKNYAWKRFLDKEEFNTLIDQADIIISHGGAGALINAIKKGKKVIAVPRLARYGEHVDDHQIQLVEQFRKQKLIFGLMDCSELESAINAVGTVKFERYVSSTQKIIDSVEKFIND